MPILLDTTYLAFKKHDKKDKNLFKKQKKVMKMENENQELVVKIKKVRDTSTVPQYQTIGAAAYDLVADFPDNEWKIPGYTTLLIPTGVMLEIPEGYAAYVLPRSGISLKTPLRIANAPGLIDSDYRGEVNVILENIGSGVATIKRGDRIAQLMFIKTERARFQEVSSLTTTERGNKGFGSTGVANI